MIQLTYEQKQMLGLNAVVELLNPASCFGREKSRRLMPYTVSQKQELLRELDNIEKICAHFDEAKPYIDALNIIFGHFKDIRPTLTRETEDIGFNDIELFEIKYFLIQSEKMMEPWQKLNDLCKLQGFSFENTVQALDTVDPDRRRIPGFYISERYSQKLKDIRQDKKEIELKIRKAVSEEEKQMLKAKRLRIVVGEEEEEKNIRREITQALGPALTDMQKNIKMTADLDLLLQKARLAKTCGCAKPKITDAEVYFEDAVHPYVARCLKEQGKTFTPISIAAGRGASVITGANMGGKSVTLKTVALNVLLTLCGFYPFAKKAGVPIFEEFYFIAEDKQSPEEGLSSFGAEIVMLDEVIRASKRAFCMIFLDEFARGTNPDEGARIVRAVTKYLNASRSVALLTTHYDHVAECAGRHYQVIGLKEVDMKKLKSEIAAAGARKGVDLIASHMNYGIYQVYGETDCPKDALNICRMLGLDEDVLNIIEKSY